MSSSHLAQNIVELALGNVALHLLVSRVIFPTVKPRRQLSAPIEGKVLIRSLDFLQTHRRI
jgi:hypothetical protein